MLTFIHQRLAYSIVATLLFFITIPGTIIHIPEKGTYAKHAFVHSVIFFIMFYFASRFIYEKLKM